MATDLIASPELRWTSKANSIVGIEQELAKIWSQVDLSTSGREDGGARHVAARTSVMNLVVVARRPEVGERCAATINQLTERNMDLWKSFQQGLLGTMGNATDDKKPGTDHKTRTR